MNRFKNYVFADVTRAEFDQITKDNGWRHYDYDGTEGFRFSQCFSHIASDGSHGMRQDEITRGREGMKSLPSVAQPLFERNLACALCNNSFALWTQLPDFVEAFCLWYDKIKGPPPPEPGDDTEEDEPIQSTS